MLLYLCSLSRIYAYGRPTGVNHHHHSRHKLRPPSRTHELASTSPLEISTNMTFNNVLAYQNLASSTMSLAPPQLDLSLDLKMRLQAYNLGHQSTGVPGESKHLKPISTSQGNTDIAQPFETASTPDVLPLNLDNLAYNPFRKMDQDERMLSWQSRAQGVVSTIISSTTLPTPSPPAEPLRYSKLLSPAEYLSFAAKHSDKMFASKEGISLKEVQVAITNAAHYKAAVDGISVLGVLLNFESGRLQHEVHRSYKDFATAINNRARLQLRTCGLTKPDMSKSCVPCKIRAPARGGKRACRKHAVCIVLDMLEVSQVNYQAEQSKQNDNDPTTLTNVNDVLKDQVSV